MRAKSLYPTKITIVWDRPMGKIDGYRLICSCSKGGAEYKIQPNRTEHTISYLKPNTPYNIKIYSYLAGSYSKKVQYNFTTLPSTPRPVQPARLKEPAICTVTNYNETDEDYLLRPKCIIQRPFSTLDPPPGINITNEDKTVYAYWSPVMGADGYYIEIVDMELSGNGTFAIPLQFDYGSNSNEAMFSTKTLRPDHEYVLNLYTIDASGKKSRPTSGKFTKRKIFIFIEFLVNRYIDWKAPTGLHISHPVQHDSVVLQWSNDQSFVDSYVLTVDNIATSERVTFHTENSKHFYNI
mgnify:CR=1 FL=1